jgi:hypothetical protein
LGKENGGLKVLQALLAWTEHLPSAETTADFGPWSAFVGWGYCVGGQVVKTHPAPEKIERATGQALEEKRLCVGGSQINLDISLTQVHFGWLRESEKNLLVPTRRFFSLAVAGI